MSYHGPRDNGEGRITDDQHDRDGDSNTTNIPSVPIPTPLRLAWQLSTLEVTTPGNPSIVELLTRPRSAHLTLGGPTAPSPSMSRAPIFRPGTFGLQPDIEQATIRLETAILEALRVAPPHLVRTHIKSILTHHTPRTPISERLAEFAANRDDPIDDV